MTLLFDDIFNIKNFEEKVFDKVTRINFTSENYDIEIALDVNTAIYPILLEDKFTIALSKTLSFDGKKDEGVFDQSRTASLADNFEYVMHGKVYKYQEDPKMTSKVSIYVSFGGLLMELCGDTRNLQEIELDMSIYLLMRKV
ncbi:DNA-directed RNA polymerases i [Anaeramoeba flamelloides]|uniref:DNA-directed RNA polymerases I, II, and III subunit RPABC3 n=1 Tax=Anaeramoeba flamelloides TaxID=1746091 RepID=A0AAV8A3I9_9EUKA|nr:DNA-directed RNA polymerases i ii and iii subunit rpabc3 [Anaeramoeba flamelloides]KAJ3446680.1 DNA-directed RNA polymerases i ii and iii subunit rpabc3 [Anaeramoeba flamelloides]KAJ6230056.1 DNA-directed RNA polymerases i [Anaeramoeba flamelloides]KAJ6251350.1 DNA-directed RNA polymerases i [Anaeramoeba flamelloides]